MLPLAPPVVTEAANRGQATVAAVKGDLVLPEKKKGRWLKRLAFLAVLGGVAVFVARKFLGSKDADWQAARPTTPYAPPKPAPAPAPTADAPTADTVVAEAEDDPQGGLSAHGESLEANDETVPDQPAEGGDAVEDASSDDWSTDEPTDQPLADTLPSDDAEGGPAGSPVEEAPAAESALAASAKYSGEGVYVGTEPPEGFTIKGNERSMKYHLPESSGYGRTIAEVWFNSEEAAQQAGFIRAQR